MATDARMIDSHAHVASPDGLRFPHSTEFPRAPKFDAPVEALLQDMNFIGVERAVLIQPSLYGFDHSYLFACLREHPSRFVGVALADPLDTHFARRLASMAQDAPIRGVRFAPLIDPSRPWFAPEAEPFINMITDLNLAICLLISSAQLEESMDWIARHPASRIVIDHLARPGSWVRRTRGSSGSSGAPGGVPERLGQAVGLIRALSGALSAPRYCGMGATGSRGFRAREADVGIGFPLRLRDRALWRLMVGAPPGA